MSKLPVLSGQEIIKGLANVGYEFDHQRGSQIVLRQKDPPNRRITIPDHKEVAKGTLRSIIREVGMTIDELVDLIR